MSVKYMAIVWEVPLPSTDKLVLLALADNARDDGCAWPLKATIRRKTGLGFAAQKMAFHRLEAGGFIRREERTNTSNLFWLDADRMAEAIPDDRREPALRALLRSVASPRPSDGRPPESVAYPGHVVADPGHVVADPGHVVADPGHLVAGGRPSGGHITLIPNPSLNPSNNLRQSDAQKALPGSRNPEAGTRKPEGLARGGAGAPDPEPEYPPEHRREMLKRLRESVRGIGS